MTRARHALSLYVLRAATPETAVSGAAACGRLLAPSTTDALGLWTALHRFAASVAFCGRRGGKAEEAKEDGRRGPQHKGRAQPRSKVGRGLNYGEMKNSDRNFPCQTLKIRKVSLVVMGS
jgi:hypothetical protein